MSVDQRVELIEMCVNMAAHFMFRGYSDLSEMWGKTMVRHMQELKKNPPEDEFFV